jgi:hypothetical protein
LRGDLLPDKSNINGLRLYFKSLNISQKKEFINNLQQKLSNEKNSKYKPFLTECIHVYNHEIQLRKNAPKNKPRPEISPESISIAIATMLSAINPGISAAHPRLTGTWRRENGERYIIFNDDGTLETNDNINREPLKGFYKIGVDGAVYIEPGGLLAIKSITVSVSGRNLTIGLEDGSVRDYGR